MTDFGVPSLLGLLEPAELELVQSLGSLRSYSDGETVHERGDTERAFNVVVSGVVRMMRLSPDGQEMVVAAINAGQNYGDPISSKGGARTLRAVARGDTGIYRFSNEAYQQLLANPAILRALYRIAMFRLDHAVELINDERSMSAEARVAKLILSMFVARGGSKRIDCAQEELAGLSGVSSVTVGKSLAVLRDEGLIKSGYRHLTICDVAALSDWVAQRGGD